VLAAIPSPPGEWPELSNHRAGDQIGGQIRHAKCMMELNKSNTFLNDNFLNAHLDIVIIMFSFLLLIFL
jgi:hypothetical protein